MSAENTPSNSGSESDDQSDMTPEVISVEDSDSNSDSESDDDEVEATSKSDDKLKTTSLSYKNLEATPSTNSRRPNSDFRTQIWSCLSSLDDSSAFAFGSSFASLPIPGLYIPGHEFIGLPLSSSDAQIIISRARPLAPLSSKKTPLNSDVSSSKIWELSGEEISLKNPNWDSAVSSMLSAIYSGLDLKSGVVRFDAKFSKLILYEPGASLERHKNTTEYTSEMFGTLIICLPSAHKGGKIVFVHGGRNYEFEAQHKSQFDFSFAAHYNDIAYDMLPITSGYRLELIYNLVRPSWPIDSTSLLHNGIRGHRQQLLYLLQRYNTEVDEVGTRLPHFLIHRLEYEDTDSHIEFEDLRGVDARQVQSLKQPLADLGFEMYLATLVFEVTKTTCEREYYRSRYYSYSDEESETETEETLSLKHIVGLDGFHIKDGCNDVDRAGLLDPEPLDEDMCDEEEDMDGRYDYSYSTVSRARQKVLVLVPPNKRMQFLLNTDKDKKRVLSELQKLRALAPDDPSKRLHLPKLCELILGQSYYSWDCYNNKWHSPETYLAIALVALDINRLDLFDKANARTSGLAVLHNAAAMGSLIARTSVAAMRDRLETGVQAATTQTMLDRFLEAVETNLKSGLAESAQFKLNDFYVWKDEALFLPILNSEPLDKANGICLFDISTKIEWSQFEENARPILETGLTIGKVSFLNNLISQNDGDLSVDQRRLAEWLVENIWAHFSFQSTVPAKADQNSYEQANYMDGPNFLFLIKNTYSILPSFTLSQKIIPALLEAVPQTSSKSMSFATMSIARWLLNDDRPDLTPISEAEGLSEEAICSSLFQIFLIIYIQQNVDPEPVSPKNWSLPTKRCDRPIECGDCSTVNSFLKHPSREVLDLQAHDHRRRHLTSIFCPQSYSRDFNNIITPGQPYDVETIRKGSPHTWRISKHRRLVEQKLVTWKKQVQTAKSELSRLFGEKDAERKLRLHLGDYYYVFMNAERDRLPALKTRFPSTELSNITEAGVNSRMGTKRSANQAGCVGEATSKKTKSNLNGEYEDSMKENIAEEIEVVDLT